MDQQAITKGLLRPYLKRVRARIAKNPDSPAWTTLDARWRGLVDHAEGIVVAYQAGRPGSRFERLAAQEVVKLGNDVEARAVVELTLAMVVMQELEPNRFRSDRAFWLQLARRVRNLTDVNFGERYVLSTGRVKRAYRELTPRAAVILGHWLAELLGVGGVYIARLEISEAKRAAEERDTLHTTLRELG